MQPPSDDDIERLFEDPDFQNLESSLAERTIFDVLGISFEERTHSRMLGWLLDPSESHGMGCNFLRQFLNDGAKLARTKNLGPSGGLPITPLTAKTYLLSDVRVNPEYVLPNARRPDLVLSSEGESWLCLIENKILSGEGEEQTTDYYKGALNSFPVSRFQKRLFVYLSPKGQAPRSEYFVPISYSKLEGTLRKSCASASNLGRTAIDQYLKCLKGRIVGQDERREICKKLYRGHAAAIDAIVQYGKLDPVSEIAERVLEALGAGPTVSNRQIEWVRKGGRSATGIWPSYWTREVGRWPTAFYLIAPTRQGLHVGLDFAPYGRNVEQAFTGSAGSKEPRGRDFSRTDDLGADAVKAADALLEIIGTSFPWIDPLMAVPSSQNTDT